MPALDVDVAARLAEEGGEPLTESLGLTDLDDDVPQDGAPGTLAPDDVPAEA